MFYQKKKSKISKIYSHCGKVGIGKADVSTICSWWSHVPPEYSFSSSQKVSHVPEISIMISCWQSFCCTFSTELWHFWQIHQKLTINPQRNNLLGDIGDDVKQTGCSNIKIFFCVQKSVMMLNVLNFSMYHFKESQYILTHAPMLCLQTSPYLIQKEGIHEGNDRFEGYCADLAKKVAEHMKINYKIVPVRDAKYGRQSENGTWDGMVGALVRHVSASQFALQLC